MGILNSVALLCILSVNCSLFSLASADTPYKELYFEQTIDHFNVYWRHYGKPTFLQRYLVQGEFEMWTECEIGLLVLRML